MPSLLWSFVYLSPCFISGHRLSHFKLYLILPVCIAWRYNHIHIIATGGNTMAEHKFKVGDIVKVLDNTFPEHLGKTGLVSHIDESTVPYRLDMKDHPHHPWYTEDDLELVSRGVHNFNVGDRVIVIAERYSNFRDKIGTIVTNDHLSNLPFHVYFGNHLTLWLAARDLAPYPSPHVPKPISPTVGERAYDPPELGIINVSSTPSYADFLFRAPGQALSSIYLNRNKVAIPSYLYHVTATCVGNATFVTIAVDAERRFDPVTQPFRVFGGIALCNEADKPNRLIGIKQACRNALSKRWRETERNAIADETYRYIRIVIKKLYCASDESYINIKRENK